MIRLAVPDDTPTLKKITTETGFFKPHEIDALQEVLDDYHNANEDAGHVCRVIEADGVIAGFVYIAPAAMTLGTWQMWWIVVRKDIQARGLGRDMLLFAEDEVRRQAGRVLFIETSSQTLYEPTRQFYRKNGYEEHAVLKDFYAEGDSMVVFRKDLREPDLGRDRPRS